MRIKKRFIAILVVLAVLFIAYLIIKPYYLFLRDETRISPVKTILSNNSVKKIGNQVNILILGIAGGVHDGPNLSDSIIVANYDFKKNRVVTINIPRDLWSDTLRDKINSAYAYGEQAQKGGGFKLAKAEAAAIVGRPIQYAAVINFEGFDELIDYVGGVEVDVQNSFTDKKYPIAGRENELCGGDPDYKCRYETISFKKGRQHMDGKTALKFVRSRNAVGREGSDFARGSRQQLVIAAIKDEILKTVKSLNLERIRNLYKGLNAAIDRDISNQQVAILAKKVLMGKDFYQKNFHLTTEMFEVPNYSDYDGKYVLIPKTGDFTAIHEYTLCLLEREDEKKCSHLIDKGEEDN